MQVSVFAVRWARFAVIRTMTGAFKRKKVLSELVPILSNNYSTLLLLYLLPTILSTFYTFGYVLIY